MDDTDLIVMWGSNAREAHPIFFHHVLKAINNGARMFAVDPRRTSSARWADVWLGIDVGSDIALSNTLAWEIIRSDLYHEDFVAHATSGFDEYAESVEHWTLQRGEEVTGVPAGAIRQLAHEYATAETAQMCWTLGITEHHNATDNVLALINLALLCGHVGRYGSGLVPVRGQNNVQGGGDMGALPNRLPGFQLVSDPELRGKFEKVWGTTIPHLPGKHISLMHEAMDEGELRALYVIGENPLQSEADAQQMERRLTGLDFMVVQDLFLTATAEIADVVLPAAGWGEVEGTFTSSERRVQRVRKAIDPPGDASDDIELMSMVARAMGHDWPTPTPEEAWDEVRSLSPMHGGMTYERLGRGGRPAVALSHRGPPRDAVPPRPAMGGGDGSEGSAIRGRVGSASGHAQRGLPASTHHRPPARLLQHRRPKWSLPLPPSHPWSARPLPRGRRRAECQRG